TVEHSIGIVTALNPYIGYTNATQIAQEALASGGSVYDLVLEKKLLSKAQLDEILHPENLTKPGRLPPASEKRPGDGRDEATPASPAKRPPSITGGQRHHLLREGAG